MALLVERNVHDCTKNDDGNDGIGNRSSVHRCGRFRPACCGRDRMSLKNQSADSLTLASNSNDTTGPSDVSNDESVFAAGETSSRLLADIQRAAPAIAARAVEIEA